MLALVLKPIILFSFLLLTRYFVVRPMQKMKDSKLKRFLLYRLR